MGHPLPAFRPILTNKENIALNGYDPVAYFTEGEPVKGSPFYRLDADGVTWQFSNRGHLERFRQNPERYQPRYGGHCSICISFGNQTEFDPAAFAIYRNSLYLFQDKEIRDIWLEDPERYIQAGDQNYAELRESPESLRILFVLTSHGEMGDSGEATGVWLSEVTYPHQIFTDAGFRVGFVSPGGGPVPIDPRSRSQDDPVNQAFMNNERWSQQLRNTMRPDFVDPSEFVAVFFAGGHGAMWDLPENPGIRAAAQAVYDGNGLIGAVCHGAAGLLNLRSSDGSYLIDGNTLSAFTNQEERATGYDSVVPFLLEDALLQQGAHILKAPPFEQQVSVSERLVTGQNPQSAAEVARVLVRLLEKQG